RAHRPDQFGTRFAKSLPAGTPTPRLLASGPPAGSIRYSLREITAARYPHAKIISVGPTGRINSVLRFAESLPAGTPTPRLLASGPSGWSKLVIIGVRQKHFPAISRPPH